MEYLRLINQAINRAINNNREGNIAFFNKKSKYIMLLLLLVMSVLFVLFFSFTTSPLYNCCGMDSAIFRVLGRLTKRGYIPYKDFFDHKGPFIITVEWLGSIISENRIGIFIVQVFFLFCSLFIAYKIFLIKYEKKKSILLTVLILLVLRVFYDGGNLTEEFCLPFLLGSFYYVCKYYNSLEKEYIKHNYYYSFFYGITVAICALTRLTNAFPLVGTIFVITIFLIFKKEYINIIQNIMAIILGAAILIMPYVLYFYIKNALYDMVYATFIYNIRYSINNSGGLSQIDIIKKYIYMMVLICTLIMGVYTVKKNNKILGYSVITMSIMGIMFHIKSIFYIHYYMIYIPIIIMSIIGIKGIELKREKQLEGVYYYLVIIASICMVAFLGVKNITGISDIYTYLSMRDDTKIKNDKMLDIVNGIDKKDMIIAYNVSPDFYLITNIEPCYKNFILQDWQTQYDNQLKNKFEHDLNSFKAKYIITGKNRNGRYISFIEKYYSQKKNNNTYIIYERNYR